MFKSYLCFRLVTLSPISQQCSFFISICSLWTTRICSKNGIPTQYLLGFWEELLLWGAQYELPLALDEWYHLSVSFSFTFFFPQKNVLKLAFIEKKWKITEGHEWYHLKVLVFYMFYIKLLNSMPNANAPFQLLSRVKCQVSRISFFPTHVWFCYW